MSKIPSSEAAVSLDIAALRVALLAIEHGSFRRVAAATGMPQPTVSRLVARLEDQVGVSLFERGPGGVRTTEAGRQFLHRAARALRELDRAHGEAATAGASEAGTISVGFYQSLVGGRLRELLNAWRCDHPGVSMRFSEASPSDQVAAIRGRLMDAGFLMGPAETSGLDTAILWSETVRVALPRHHKFADRQTLSWEDVRDERFLVPAAMHPPGVTAWLAGCLGADGPVPRIEEHQVSIGNLLGLVAIGYGATLMSDRALFIPPVEGVVAIPLEGPGADVEVRVVWHPGNDNPASRRFVSFVRNRHRTSATLDVLPGAG